METPQTSQGPSGVRGIRIPRLLTFYVPLLSPAARFWIAVVIFLILSLLALWQSPRPDALRPPRWIASVNWWRYPLEWNAASRLPKIECGLNAIQAVPNTSSIWAVGNKGMVVTSNDGGRTWTKKSLENAQAAPFNSPTAAPSTSPLPSSKGAQSSVFQLPDLVPTALAASEASVVDQKPVDSNAQRPPPSPSPSNRVTKPNLNNASGSEFKPTPTPTPSRSSTPTPVRRNPSPRPSSARANASPIATPLNPNATPTTTPTEIESLIAVSFVDLGHGKTIGTTGKQYRTTDGGENWAKDYPGFSYSGLVSIRTADESKAELVVFDSFVRSVPRPYLLEFFLPFRNAFIPSTPSNSTWFVTAPITRTAVVRGKQTGSLAWFGASQSGLMPDLSGGRVLTVTGDISPLGKFEYLTSVSGVSFLSNQTNGWFVTTDGSVYDTANEGSSWRRLRSPQADSLYGVFFATENRGWVVGTNGIILSTNEGGANWQEQTSGTKSQLNSINFLPDGQHGWIAGNDGLILSTDDGGATWVHRTQGPEGNDGRYLRFPAPWYLLSLCLVVLLMWRRIEPPAAEPEESVADVLVSDRPLEEAAGDVLAFNTIARGLSRFLRNENTLPPLTIAITGEWGTGKSSLMNLLRADLRSYKFHPVWFNAWHHQKEEHILASLLENIKLQAVPRWWTTRGLIFRARLLKIRGWRQWGPVVLLLFFIYVMLIYHYGHHGTEANFAGLIKNLLAPFDHSGSSPAERSNFLTLLPLIAGVVTFLGAIWRGITAFGVKPASLLAGVSRGVSIRGLEAQTSFRQKFAVEFNDVTRALGQRSMLIFIDDLDRCRPENVSETLEAVNFLTTSGECFVAIGMAREYVERCVGRAFKEVAEEMIDDNVQNQTKSADEVAREKRVEFARQYLDKLINIEVPVPAPKQSQSLALLVASTRDSEHTRPLGHWQQFKLSLVNLIEKQWRLAPALLALGGLLFLGYYLALGLRDAGTVIQPAETIATPSEPTPQPSPLPTPSAAPSASTIPTPTPTPTPVSLNERAELVQGGRGILSRGFLPVIALLVLIWIGVAILTRRPGLVVKDSSRFVKALEIWHPLVFARQPTPRATKRFMNYVRYLAMRQRRQGDSQPPLKHFLERLKERITGVHQLPDPMAAGEPSEQSIPDEVLVALAALQHLKPGCLDDLPGPTSSPDDVWPRPVIPGGPLAPLFDKAWREHEATFSNWGKLSQYRSRFLEMTAHVQVR